MFALAALLAAASLAPAAERRPNFVLLLADDLGWGDVGFNGRTDWKTPHLDNLASQGTVFKRWYVAAVVCAPSRAALMTGKYTIHNGVSGNKDDLPPNAVRTLFWEWRVEGHNQLAALRGDLKLLVTPGNPPELYNVETDPAERRVLNAEYPMLVTQLKKELDAWLATETEESKWGKTPKKP